MASERSCSVAMSALVLCHNTAILSQCLVVLAQHARRDALGEDAALMQLCSL